MIGSDQDKKKKKGLGLDLYDKMGLDQRSEQFAPSAPPPDTMGMSAEAALNQRTREEEVGMKVQDKLRSRRLMHDTR